MVALTNEDFATEVKSDRLKALYQFTLAFCLVVMVFIMTFGFVRSVSSNVALAFAVADISLVAACLITRLLLNRSRFVYAAWSYSLGAVAATTVLLLFGDTRAYNIIPFTFPVFVFLVGLMLPPIHTFAMASVCSGIVLIVPGLAPHIEMVDFASQIVAIIFMFFSAVLSAQVTGELYQITEWALMNYQKERRTNDELFEKRHQLQRSLKRSEALSDELREINTELEVAKAAAEEAKHFRGQFLANMSHELRTPLNAIIGFSETMLKFPVMYDNEPLPNAYEGDIGQIYNSGRQLLHVINDILDLAKVDAGKLDIRMQVVDILPIINAASATSKGLIGSRPIILKKNIPDPPPKVWADESRLRQVLLNLYSNAAKYTDKGEIELTVVEIENEVKFSLRDTGSGIEDKFHPTIFEEFRQGDTKGRDPRSGAGLGLAISKQLVTLMGGRIWFESKIGVGSTFHFVVLAYREQDKFDNAQEDATQPERPSALSLEPLEKKATEKLQTGA